ncbi:hypothetical protein ACN28S_09185 [Cystobacter fuscus]
MEAGEVLGFLRPLPGHSAILHGHLKDFEDERNAPESARKSKEMKLDAGFMHFQVFSPEDAPDNGIKLLVELAEKLDTKNGGKPRFVELKEDTQDNFLELDEIKNHLTTTLPRRIRRTSTRRPTITSPSPASPMTTVSATAPPSRTSSTRTPPSPPRPRPRLGILPPLQLPADARGRNRLPAPSRPEQHGLRWQLRTRVALRAGARGRLEAHAAPPQGL